ncbi:PREDICTED: ribosomal RNA processing protein 1 homolog B [Elephantulus edwardii]|uniref:ribosomal RNA processing protein 1 homolog B n=1 Tax=Elephantulus edwardii TaxID=28737 RepID=UPI0003F0DE89|nr:PREDICTED: ribosomal RNA processing protein 1 homolog B [Elephantulus edwardii]
MAPAMQPAEIQFAQRLASNEKGIRDRAVKKLRQYISVKTQRETGGFSQEELLKIWKGLFYCMWVQDEPLLQEELANTISQLVHVVNNSEAQHLFIQTFWQTMNREWKGIDKLHLNKYYTLIRLVLRQSFEVLKQNAWEESQIKLLLDILMKEILHPESQSPNEVKFHFVDIYLDELTKVGGKELLAHQNIKFIDPFCKIVAETKDSQSCQYWLSLNKIPSHIGSPALGKHHSRKDSITDAGEKNSCGTCEDPGSLLQFDHKAVANQLLEITNRKNIPPFNQKCLSKLIKKFQDFSEAGTLSRFDFDENISAGEDEQPNSQGQNKKKGNKPSVQTHLGKEKGNKSLHVEEEESGGSTQKRKRKKKKKNHLQPENLSSGDKAMSSNQNESNEPEGKKRKAQKVLSVAETEAEASSTMKQGGLVHAPTMLTYNKKKRPKKKILRVRQKGNGEAFSPLKKKQKVKAENDFVKFDTPFTPKPLFFRKARSTGSISFKSPTVQLNKIPSSSKKVTFGLNRNMTAEFRKTDKSILVSPTGPFRVAFNPELRPLHGVLKTPTSSPCSTPVAPKKVMSTPPPKRRPTAMDFF